MRLWKSKSGPKIGDIYVQNKGNPFGPPFKMEVVDVKGNWIRYIYHHKKLDDSYYTTSTRYEMPIKELKWLYIKE